MENENDSENRFLERDALFKRVAALLKSSELSKEEKRSLSREVLKIIYNNDEEVVQ